MVLIGDLDVVDHSVHHYRQRFNDDERYQEERMKGSYIVNTVPPSWNSHVKDSRHVYLERQYSVRTCYYNYTDRPINIVERSGIPMPYLPDPRKDVESRIGVVIRREVFFDGVAEVQRSLHGFSQMQPLKSDEAMKAQAYITRLLRPQFRNMTKYGMNLVTEYFIPLSDLQGEAAGCLYHHATDVLISLMSMENTPRHPASSEYIEFHTRTLLQAPEQGQNDVIFIMRYVSDDPQALPKYVQVAGKVLTLRPERNHPSKLTQVQSRDKRSETIDELASEYIEVIYSASVDTNDPATTGMRIRRIGLDDAKANYGVFDSYQDIAVEKHVFESQLRKLKDKSDQLSLDLQREKREADEKLRLAQRAADDKLREKDLKITELEYTISELKRQESVRLELVSAAREQVIHKQKVKFEFGRFLMNVFTVVIGILPALFKLFGPRLVTAK